MRRLTVVIASTAAATALAVSGCSSSGTGPGSDELTYEDSPLSQFMGDGGEFDEEEYAAQDREVQELVAECMADEGFEYIPVDMTQYTTFSDDMEDMDTEEWVSQNGYGFNMSSESASEESEMPEDPNQDYVESLSTNEQTAYYEALYGPGPSDDEIEEDGSYEYNWEEAGCQGAAEYEVRGDMMGDQDEFGPLFDAMTEMYEQARTDPGLADVNAEWASCMADAGYADFAQPEDAMNDAMEASNALWEESGGDTPSDEAMAEARETEIEIALADFRCKEKVDYDDRSLEVQFALEEQFIEDHREELEAYRAAQESGN